MTSASEQDYLRTILELQAALDMVRMSDLASAMAVTSPSVTEMAKNLSEQGLVDYTPYRGVALTHAGRRLAERIAGRNSLIREYLARILDLPENEAEMEADRLEHVLSEELEARMGAALAGEGAE